MHPGLGWDGWRGPESSREAEPSLTPPRFHPTPGTHTLLQAPWPHTAAAGPDSCWSSARDTQLSLLAILVPRSPGELGVPRGRDADCLVLSEPGWNPVTFLPRALRGLPETHDGLGSSRSLPGEPPLAINLTGGSVRGTSSHRRSRAFGEATWSSLVSRRVPTGAWHRPTGARRGGRALALARGAGCGSPAPACRTWCSGGPR